MIAPGRCRRLIGDRRGGTGLMLAAAMPLLVGAGALAVDLGSVQLETRRLQGIVDAAALAAASAPDRAQAVAEASVGISGWPHAARITAVSGRYTRATSVAPAARFAAGAATPDAARVTIESESPTFLARIFGSRSVTISRTATAARQRVAAFSIGSRLASLNGGLVNAYLTALTGSAIALNVMDYQALASADLDLLGFLPLLRTQAGLDAASFTDVLNADVRLPTALSAVAARLLAEGDTGAAAALSGLAATLPGNQTIKLRALIDAGPLGAQSSGGEGIAQVNALALVTAMLQLASPNRQVSLDLGADIPSLTTTRLTIAVGERVSQSPWIAIGDDRAPIVRTAQTRVYLQTRIGTSALPGIAGLAAIDVPLFVELAAAEGRVTGIECPTPPTTAVTLQARTSPGRAALGTVNAAVLGDFGTPITVGTATLVDTPLIDVTGSSNVDLGAAEPWQTLRFEKAAIDGGTAQTVRSSTLVGGVATSLLAHPTLGVRVLGLPIPLDPLLSVVGGLLRTAAPALDGLLGLVTGTLGVGIGEADLRVTGVRCGQPVLVA